MCTGLFREMENADDKKAEKHAYQELLGCLLFIATRTRPDIGCAVSIPCRYASNPKLVHWNQLKIILRYLSGTRTHGLFFTSEKGALNAYCDADWAGDRSDRKVTTGFIIFVGTSPVFWQSPK